MTLVPEQMHTRPLLLIFALTLGACGEPRGDMPMSEISGQTMGTSFSIKLDSPGGESGEDFIERHVIDVLSRVNQRMSTWLPESELSVFNANPATDWIATSTEFCDVISAALAVSERTGGAFDITVGPLVNLWGFGPVDTDHAELPSYESIALAAERVGYRQLQTDCEKPAIRKKRADVYVDLSAYAKGYAVDQLADFLDTQGVDNYLVEVGGELRMRGKNASGENWAIAVEKPADFERSVQAIVRLTDMAMATSGDYRNFYVLDGRRYSHTIDSRTGRPVTHDAAAVTVISDTAAMADALATALLVMGPDQGFRFAEQERIAAYFLLRKESGIDGKATTVFTDLSER
jgi:thiamine biosynthesis lipoprotein